MKYNHNPQNRKAEPGLPIVLKLVFNLFSSRVILLSIYFCIDTWN